MAILLLDVGNSRLKWGLYQLEHHDGKKPLCGVLSLEGIEKLSGQIALRDIPEKAIGCIVSGASVQARVDAQINVLGIQIRWISSVAEQCGLVNHYQYPNLLGSDRWAALIGALQHVKKNEPVLVVNVGTAVTIDCINHRREFIGGMILPGFGLMLRALEMGTAGLRVPEGNVCEFPRNTSNALMTGGAMAMAGAVQVMFQRLKKVCNKTPRCLLTGGAVSKLADNIELEHTVIDQLVFDGLLAIEKSQATQIQTLEVRKKSS